MEHAPDVPPSNGIRFRPIEHEGDILVKLNESLFLRLSPRSWPKNMKTADIQKGLILLELDRELVEEGVGFGVPTAIYHDGTYLSGTARMHVQAMKANETVLTKIFDLDTVSKRRWRRRVFNAHGPAALFIIEPFRRLIEKLYLFNKTVQKFTRFSLAFEKKMGIERRFVRMQSRGQIAVTYMIGRNLIHVGVDLHALRREGCEKIFILNEQGSTYFRKYEDGGGLRLLDGSIEAWSRVDSDWVCISGVDDDISFKLRAMPGSRMYRGREFLDGYLSWTGLAYEIDPSNLFFSYDIEVHRGRMR